MKQNLWLNINLRKKVKLLNQQIISFLTEKLIPHSKKPLTKNIKLFQ